MKNDVLIVSACLLGINCKYSGSNNLNEKVKKLCNNMTVIPICPEQLGGMTTPRKPAEIKGGSGKEVLDGKARVFDKDGKDVTEYYISGAKETLKIVKMFDAKKAILKANSPSCGCGTIYDGNFIGNKINGNGVTAEVLKKNGIEILNELDIK
ncbi:MULTISPECIES: DUF523 domain-containing protein [Clostridium]|uniref:DUF523 domain-containing protein n=1 Tax=Clostridium TaxID=1485 RepID=UPI0008254D8B|nr:MULTISPECIES: DUF523 domain-containing protein [Clostridium]PJI09702.1 DUF523 domain-containing protein [Clostridium sp. CT7]